MHNSVFQAAVVPVTVRLSLLWSLPLLTPIAALWLDDDELDEMTSKEEQHYGWMMMNLMK